MAVLDWSEDFEAASFGSKYTVNGAPTLDAATPIRGSQSFQCNGASCDLSRAISSSVDRTVSVGSFEIRFNSTPVITTGIVLWAVQTFSGNTNPCQIKLTTTNHLQANITGGTSVTAAAAIVPGTTYIIDYRVYFTAGGIQFDWSINLVPQTSITLATTTQTRFSNEIIGNSQAGGVTTLNFDIDAIQVSRDTNAYPIGPPDAVNPSIPVAYGPTLVYGNGDQVIVEVSWEDGPAFTLGSSIIGGPDELGGNFPFEQWTDITADVTQVDISRGRQDATSAIQQSTCTITLFDNTGKYNPRNTTGPYYGQLVPSRPVRVRATFQSEEFILWTGTISEVIAAASLHDPFATISGVDLLERLSVDEPTIETIPVTTTGGAINAVLDAVGWFSDRRSLTTGDPLVNFGTDTAQQDASFIVINDVTVRVNQTGVKALDMISQILEHEGGIFFIAADGTATYLPYFGTQMIGATVTTTSLITPGESIDTIYNRAQVTPPAGNMVEFIDGSSAQQHGIRDVPGSPVTAQWLPAGPWAGILAERLVRVNQTSPVWGLTLQRADVDNDPDAAATYQAMLALDIGSRITLDDAASQTAGDYSIEGINHTIQAGTLDFSTTWVLRMRPINVFVIGQSLIGGPDTLGI